jgi:hypothetical protein
MTNKLCEDVYKNTLKIKEQLIKDWMDEAKRQTRKSRKKK